MKKVRNVLSIWYMNKFYFIMPTAKCDNWEQIYKRWRFKLSFGVSKNMSLRIFLIFCMSVEDNRAHCLSVMVFLKKTLNPNDLNYMIFVCSLLSHISSIGSFSSKDLLCIIWPSLVETLSRMALYVTPVGILFKGRKFLSHS